MNRRLKTLVLGAIPLVALTALSTVDHIPGTDVSLTIPYAAEGPGPTYDVLALADGEPVVDIHGAHTYPTSGSLRMTTVLLHYNLTFAQSLVQLLTTHDTFVPIEAVIPQNLSFDEVEQMNQEAFAGSESAATVAAMHYLGRPLAVEVGAVAKDSPADGVLVEGQRILRVDGQPVDTAEQVQSTVRAKKPGDTIELVVAEAAEKSDHGDRAAQKTVTVTLGEAHDSPGQAFLGVGVRAVPADDTSVTFHLEDVGGPSAGLIFTLGVIDKLTEQDITGGKNIAGTGTMAEDGTVGRIGGIRHKIEAAHKDAHADVFLAPEENCAEALTADRGDMPLIRVHALDDAITSLKAYNEGKPYPTCE